MVLRCARLITEDLVCVITSTPYTHFNPLSMYTVAVASKSLAHEQHDPDRLTYWCDVLAASLRVLCV